MESSDKKETYGVSRYPQSSFLFSPPEIQFRFRHKNQNTTQNKKNLFHRTIFNHTSIKGPGNER
jgi:hypothetical protein